MEYWNQEENDRDARIVLPELYITSNQSYERKIKIITSPLSSIFPNKGLQQNQEDNLQSQSDSQDQNQHDPHKYSEYLSNFEKVAHDAEKQDQDCIGLLTQNKLLADELMKQRQQDMTYRLKNGASVVKQYLIKQSVEELESKIINKHKPSVICQMQQLFNILNDFFLAKSVELLEIKYVFTDTDKKSQPLKLDWITKGMNLSQGTEIFNKIEDSIQMINQLNQKETSQKQFISLSDFYDHDKFEEKLKEIYLSSWRSYKNYVHIFFKVVVSSFEKYKINKINLTDYFKQPFKAKVLQAHKKTIAYTQQRRYLLPINDWGLGSFIYSEYYQYFSVMPIHAFARKKSIQTRFDCYFKMVKEEIRQLVIVSDLFNQTKLKLVIKWEKISNVQLYCSPPVKDGQGENRKKVYYIHLADCPQFYIKILERNKYVNPRYESYGERVQNFPILSNSIISQNDVLRMFLYNNTVLKIEVTESSKNNLSKVFSENILKVVENYKKYMTLSQISIFPQKGKKVQELNNIFNYKQLEMILLNFNIANKELAVNHLRWKITYDILLLVRYNLIGADYQQVLRFIRENLIHLEVIHEILLNQASSLSKKSLINDEILLIKLRNSLQQRLINIEEKQEPVNQGMCRVYKMFLTPSGIIFNSPTFQNKCRVLKQYSTQSQFFAKITLKDDSSDFLKNKNYLLLRFLRRYLTKAIVINKQYIPLASSSSQLRNSSLWVLCETGSEQGSFRRVDRDNVLQFLGNFTDIYIPAKKYARIGQSFSSSWSYNGVNFKSKIIKDIQSNGYLFTDGIGRIQKQTLSQIVENLPIRQKEKICCLQIRFEGAKGVLTECKFETKKNQMSLRPSMVKYKCKNESVKKYFDVLDWNKYKSGFLNRQLIVLFRTLNIKDEVFQDIQTRYMCFLERLTYDQVLSFRLLHTELDDLVNNLEPSYLIISQMRKAGFNLNQESFYQGVLKYLRKEKLIELKKNCHILVQKSARIIGIIDQYGLLEEGELFCKLYNQENQDKQYNITGSVAITKNPALDPADVRLMKCISEQEIAIRCKQKGYPQNYFSPFNNCIVFPCKGQYPVTVQISGSDLDGDNFFICWDEHLLIEKEQKAKMIDQPNKLKKKQEAIVVGYESMMDFVVSYINSEKLGTIDNNHLAHADKNIQKCADNQICNKLSYLHGKAVDYVKTGQMPQIKQYLYTSSFPTFMKQQGATYQSKSILGTLYNEASTYLTSTQTRQEEDIKGFIDMHLITHQILNLDENEISQILYTLYQYQAEMQELIKLLHVKNQYQIYLGHFDIKQMRRKNLGPNRIYMFILSLRRKFFEIFFKLFPREKEQYYSINYYQQKNRSFDSKIQKKCIGYYLISYICRFKELPKEQSFLLSSIREKVERKARELNYNGSFCGFVWFVIPKLMIYIKNVKTNGIIEEKK